MGRWGRIEECLSQRRVGGGPQYPSSSFSPNTTFPLSNKFHWRLREAAAEAVFLGYNGYRGERGKGEGGKANFSPIPLFLLPSLRIPRFLMEFLLSLSSLSLLPSHICRCEPPSIAASSSARGSRLHRLGGREGGNEMGKLAAAAAAAAARRVGVDWIYLGYRTPSPPSSSMTRVGVSQAVASKALQYRGEVQGGIGRSVFVQAWNLLFSPCNIRLACNVILI